MPAREDSKQQDGFLHGLMVRITLLAAVLGTSDMEFYYSDACSGAATPDAIPGEIHSTQLS